MQNTFLIDEFTFKKSNKDTIWTVSYQLNKLKLF